MKKERRRKVWSLIKRLFLWLFILQLVYIIFCRWINPPITLTQVSSLVHGYGLQRDYIRFDEMGPNIKLAVMASEDQLFPIHNGFIKKAIEEAIKYNETHSNKRRGGSTISQQVAKNVFLWQQGGYIRKGLEFYFTFMIEKIWNKKRILEMYLNVSEMGKGVFGIQAAAKKYFNKDAKDLTRNEAAMIAARLPNPKEYTIKPLSNYVAKRTGDIMRQMNYIESVPEIQAIIK
jgi:monofunctional biosynthetic peptidoglycan transglycosylase